MVRNNIFNSIEGSFTNIDSTNIDISNKLTVGRITTTDRDLLTNVVDGMMIYNTTTSTFQVRKASTWENLDTAGVGGDIESLANLGTGTGIWKDTVSNVARLHSLKPGNQMEISLSSDEITYSVSTTPDFTSVTTGIIVEGVAGEGVVVDGVTLKDTAVTSDSVTSASNLQLKSSGGTGLDIQTNRQVKCYEGILDSTVPSSLKSHANYDTNQNLTIAAGSSLGTLNGSATVSSGQLDLSVGDNAYLDYSATSNADFTQIGTIRIGFIPTYTGSPSAEQNFFIVSKAASISTNLILLRQLTNGNMRLFVIDSSNVTKIDVEIGAYSAVSSTKVDFELNYDFTAGQTRLFLDGVQLGSTIVTTLTRDTNIALLRIGDTITGDRTANFKAPYFSVYNTVQHTSNFTPDSGEYTGNIMGLCFQGTNMEKTGLVANPLATGFQEPTEHSLQFFVRNSSNLPEKVFIITPSMLQIASGKHLHTSEIRTEIVEENVSAGGLKFKVATGGDFDLQINDISKALIDTNGLTVSNIITSSGDMTITPNGSSDLLVNSQIIISNTDAPILKGIRTISAGGSAAYQIQILKTHFTGGDMPVGLGAAQVFMIEDNTSGEQIIGSIGCVRFGSDDTGQISITPTTGGVLTDAVLVDGTRTDIKNSLLNLPTITTTARDLLSALNGDLIYNSTLDVPQLYENGGWVTLDSGTGDVTDGLNIGSGTANVFSSKNGTVLEFRKLNNTDSNITIVDNGNQIDFSLSTSTISINQLKCVRETSGTTGSYTVQTLKANSSGNIDSTTFGVSEVFSIEGSNTTGERILSNIRSIVDSGVSWGGKLEIWNLDNADGTTLLLDMTVEKAGIILPAARVLRIGTNTTLSETTLGVDVLASSLTSLGPQAEALDMNTNDITSAGSISLFKASTPLNVERSSGAITTGTWAAQKIVASTTGTPYNNLGYGPQIHYHAKSSSQDEILGVFECTTDGVSNTGKFSWYPYNAGVGTNEVFRIDTAGIRSNYYSNFASANIVIQPSTSTNSVEIKSSTGSINLTIGANVLLQANGTTVDIVEQVSFSGVYGAAISSTDEQMFVDITSKKLVVLVSALKYKENIRDWTVDPKVIYALKPRIFDLKKEYRSTDDRHNIVGLIAEEVKASGLDCIVKYKDGEINGVDYQMLCIPLLCEIQHLATQQRLLRKLVMKQREQISTLAKALKDQRERHEKLKTYTETMETRMLTVEKAMESMKHIFNEKFKFAYFPEIKT